MSKLKKTFALAFSVLALAFLSVTQVQIAAADFEPRKPVDFVIMAGKGGGADKMARLMQSIIEKHGLASKPFCSDQQAGRVRRRSADSHE